MPSSRPADGQVVCRDARVFTCRSLVAGRAAAVFEWHERPEALLDLMPWRRFVRIERRTGGLRDGGLVTFSIGVGPWRARWEARHHGYLRGERFCDEQVRGPFKTWRHTHQFVAIGTGQTLYEDRVEYRDPRRPAGTAAGRPLPPTSARAHVRVAPSRRARGLRRRSRPADGRQLTCSRAWVGPRRWRRCPSEEGDTPPVRLTRDRTRTEPGAFPFHPPVRAGVSEAFTHLNLVSIV